MFTENLEQQSKEIIWLAIVKAAVVRKFNFLEFQCIDSGLGFGLL